MPVRAVTGAVLLVASLGLGGCGDDSPSTTAEPDETTQAAESTETETDTDIDPETETETATDTDTGSDEPSYPDCTAPDAVLAEFAYSIVSPAWELHAGSMNQYLIDGGRCTIDSVEYIANDVPYAKFALSCVRELDQVEFDDFELRVGMESFAGLLEFAIGTEVDIRFEHQDWFTFHPYQRVFTMRDLDGVLLFAAGSQLFGPMSFDPDGTPRWAWSSIAGPDTDPAAVADWLAPLSPIELVDDACPVETFDGFVGDTERRFGLRATDDQGEFLAVDRSIRTLILDGLSYELAVHDASAWWHSDTPENAEAHVAVVLVIADG